MALELMLVNQEWDVRDSAIEFIGNLFKPVSMWILQFNAVTDDIRTCLATIRIQDDICIGV